MPITEGVRSWYYTYEVSADVTNVAGETQEGTLALPLGSSSLRLFIPDWEGATIVKEQQKTINHLYKRLSDIGKEKDDVESKLADTLEQVEKYANRVEDLARNLVKRDEEIAALKKEIEEESITVKPKSPPRVARKRADPKPRPEPKTATEKKAKVKELKKEKIPYR